MASRKNLLQKDSRCSRPINYTSAANFPGPNPAGIILPAILLALNWRMSASDPAKISGMQWSQPVELSVDGAAVLLLTAGRSFTVWLNCWKEERDSSWKN